jgi:transposase
VGRTIGRERCRRHGFTVKLIAPQFVKPYVKSNKNDANDAEAICEAMSRPNMRFVAVKSVAQQDLQAARRVRAELSNQRKAKANHRDGAGGDNRRCEAIHQRPSDGGIDRINAKAKQLRGKRAFAMHQQTR